MKKTLGKREMLPMFLWTWTRIALFLFHSDIRAIPFQGEKQYNAKRSNNGSNERISRRWPARPRPRPETSPASRWPPTPRCLPPGWPRSCSWRAAATAPGRRTGSPHCRLCPGSPGSRSASAASGPPACWTPPAAPGASVPEIVAGTIHVRCQGRPVMLEQTSKLTSLSQSKPLTQSTRSPVSLEAEALPLISSSRITPNAKVFAWTSMKRLCRESATLLTDPPFTEPSPGLVTRYLHLSKSIIYKGAMITVIHKLGLEPDVHGAMWEESVPLDLAVSLGVQTDADLWWVIFS